MLDPNNSANKSQSLLSLKIVTLAELNLSISTKTPVHKPGYGFLAAQNRCYFYYKINAFCTHQVVFIAINISNACTHEFNYLNDLKSPSSLRLHKRRNQVNIASLNRILNKASYNFKHGIEI